MLINIVPIADKVRRFWTRPTMPSFKVGDEVMAKWPGSNLWFKSKILAVTEDEYKVRYTDGTEEEIPKKDVMVRI